MLNLFSGRTKIAIFTIDEMMTSKFNTLFVDQKEQCEVTFFDDLEKFKEYLKSDYIHIAFCDIEEATESSKEISGQYYVRELMELKMGTYFIYVSKKFSVMNLINFYRIGLGAALLQDSPISDFRKELKIGIDRISSWKDRFEQMATDADMQEELLFMMGKNLDKL